MKFYINLCTFFEINKYLGWNSSLSASANRLRLPYKGHMPALFKEFPYHAYLSFACVVPDLVDRLFLP